MLFAFDVLISMCLFHLKLLVIVMPRFIISLIYVLKFMTVEGIWKGDYFFLKSDVDDLTLSGMQLHHPSFLLKSEVVLIVGAAWYHLFF